jgi:glycogen debranching enzyme
MKTIGYLVDESRAASLEEQSAWEWLSSQREWASRKVSFQRLAQSLDGCEALWLHDDSSLIPPAPLTDETVRSLLWQFVNKGGGLMLSLLGAQAVVPLGWESNTPNVVRKSAWDERCWAEGYPDIRGFSGFLGHPVFEGLRGAAYTWLPSAESPFAGAFYESPHGPLEGRVVAVERQYIKLNDDRRLIWEYQSGKGSVLAVGSFLFFAAPGDRFRPHRDMLTGNCLRCVLGPSDVRRTYWDFGERQVRAVRQSSLPVSVVPRPLPDAESGLSIVREPAEVRNNVFDVGGRRILVMGREQTGIQEIWCHPVRVLRDLRIGVRLGQEDVLWLSDYKPKMTIRPESVTRAYKIGGVTIVETTFASQKDPVAAICIALNATEPFELVVACSIDLRLMWPLPDHATGSLVHSWDDGLRAFVVGNALEGLCSVFGSSRTPDDVLAGRFSAVTMEGGKLAGIPSERIEVGLAMRYTCRQKSEEINLVVAGSDQGSAEAVTAYRHALKHPGSLLAHQVEHIRRLFGSSTMLHSPDVFFNDGYRWALAALDRFLVHTPSLGTSLMAGFGTTDRGWDGNQPVSGRPGYAWYFGRDAVWSAFALLEAGQVESVKDVLTFLGDHQDLTGKIVHEMTTSGHAHYDAADSTPLYCILCGRYLRVTGDKAFARSQFARLARAVEFCLGTDTDGDWLIENTNVGHGWIEGGALFGVHSELYLASCWAEALVQAAFVAEVAGKADLAKAWKERGSHVRSVVSRDFWNDKTAFYSYAKLADGTYRQERTMLPAVAAYFGCVEPGRMAASFNEYASAEFSADWGVRIIGRSDPMFSPTGYHCGSVWPLFTGWVSLAEFALGRPFQGCEHLLSNLGLFTQFTAGCCEEVLHGERFEPAGVCSHQAWSESMVLQPALEGLAGICADARRMKLHLRPYLPASWNELTLERVSVGEAHVDASFERKPGKTTFSFHTDGKSPLAVTMQILLPLGTVVHSKTVDGKTTAMSVAIRTYADCPTISFTLKGALKGSIQYTDGVCLEPLAVHPKIGSMSSGVRCVEERTRDGRLELLLEGPDGRLCTAALRDPSRRVVAVEGAERWERNAERIVLTLNPQASLLATGYRRSVIRLQLTAIEAFP